jgi:ketosteroid isomerase-like protein
MNNNALLIEKLFTSLDKHDHQSMADCYHTDARFTDIAFDLTGKKQIHAMWHLICEGNIHTTLISFDADEQKGKAELVDEYTFSDTGRPVKNTITSNFKFQNGLIVEHHDICDAEDWAEQALGGVKGFLAGKFGFLRGLTASQKLSEFIDTHPQYK